MKSVFKSADCCSGCGVCQSVCPCGAITMQADPFGSLYPVIQEQKCTDCQSCTRHCHFLSENSAAQPAHTIVSLQSKNQDALKTSQSGGAFFELAKAVLETGGVVYGAAFTEDFQVAHTRVISAADLHKLQGSKYVQSNTAEIFKSVRRDLQGQLPVLFSGTPCQIAALKSYLKQPFQNLFTADVICHGVMQPNLWRDYLCFIESKYGKITRANFRDKSFGWQTHDETFVAGNKKIKKNIYRKIFYKDLFLRPCCYSQTADGYTAVCRYAGMNRSSDITIGDYWGLPRSEAAYGNADRGVSLCLINTEQGQMLFDRIKPCVLWRRETKENAVIRQPHLSRSGDCVPAKELQYAREMYVKKGFGFIASKYGESGVRGIMPKGIRFLRHVRNQALKNGV